MTRLRKLVREIIIDEFVRFHEDTLLRSLVAKTDEKTANQAVSLLKSKDVDARSAYPSKFGLSTEETPSWGVYVEPTQVKRAAKLLSPMSDKLQFDPFVKTGK